MCVCTCAFWHARLERELEAVRETQHKSAERLVHLQHQLEEMRARAAEHKSEAERLRRQQDEMERNTRGLEQKLIESRAREETAKDQLRRFEEEKDELQLAADQAAALKEQAQREIARLSDRLQQVLVEAQARSEETVSSIRAKYQTQKARLQQNILELEVEVSTLQADKERLVRDCKSAEAEVHTLAREGPGGNLGRLHREIDTLTQTCKDLSTQRDQALHGARASELAVRRKEAQWEQSQLQSAAQIESLTRRLQSAEAETGEAKDQAYKLRVEVEALERHKAELEREAKERQAEAQDRVARLTQTLKKDLEEMQERVRRAEAAEESSKQELAQLLSAHDKLQDKWREASRDMAAQSQRSVSVSVCTSRS